MSSWGGNPEALLVWRQNSLEMKSLEPLAHFADDHSAEYFWALLEQLATPRAPVRWACCGRLIKPPAGSPGTAAR
jgi:hypothetical protein